MGLGAPNAIIANILALVPLPAMKVLDHMNSGCGDGLCGFFSGMLILGGLAVATLVFLFRSANREEKPAVLRMIPFVLWIAALAPMFI